MKFTVILVFLLSLTSVTAHSQQANIFDTCFSSYHKILKTPVNQKIGQTLMLRNGVQVVSTSHPVPRGNNVLVPDHNVQIYDAGGRFIKGLNFLRQGTSPEFFLHKVTDSTFIVNIYWVDRAVGSTTLMLFDENLNLIWEKCILLPIYAGGSTVDPYLRIHQDEKNLWIFDTDGAFSNTIWLAKFDLSGNPVWFKRYTLQGSLGNIAASIVTTTNDVIFIAEGRSEGTSLRVDKLTGTPQNAYRFNLPSGFINTHQYANYQQGRILYVGTSVSTVIGSFDSLGKPLKLRRILNGTQPDQAAFANGMLYANFKGYQNQRVLLKADTALNLVFVRQYSNTNSLRPTSMIVNERGNVHEWGNDASSTDAYFKKYETDGTIGVCPSTRFDPDLVDIDPAPVAQPVTAANLTLPFATRPFIVTPDAFAYSPSTFACAPPAACTTLKLAGSNRVCASQATYLYKANRETGCTTPVLFSYDSSLANAVTTTDSSVLLIFKKSGTVWVRSIMISGCSPIMDSMQVTINAPLPTPQLGRDTSLCSGTSLLLHAGKNYASYQWNDGSADSTLFTNAPGLFFVHATDGCGNMLSDSITISLAPATPIASIPDRTSCNPDTVKLTAPAGFVNYVWTDASNNTNYTGSSLIVNQTMGNDFYLKAKTAAGCLAYDTVTVKFLSAPIIDLGPSIQLCAGDSTRLDAGIGFQTYAWKTGELTQHVMAHRSAMYVVTATTSEGCRRTDSVQVTVRPAMSLQLQKDIELCAGEMKTLSPGTFSSYQWNNGATSPTLAVSTIGTYSVIVKDEYNCIAKDSATVVRINSLPAGFLPKDTAVCARAPIELRTVGQYTRYLWSTGSSLNKISISTAGTYSLEVTDQKGCKASGSFLVQSKTCPEGFFAPTAFTPNNDGRNDVFRPLLFGNIKFFKLVVYNRWGDVVFQSMDPKLGWDGKINGVLQSGTFAWVCTYEVDDLPQQQRKSTVLLIR